MFLNRGPGSRARDGGAAFESVPCSGPGGSPGDHSVRVPTGLDVQALGARVGPLSRVGNVEIGAARKRRGKGAKPASSGARTRSGTRRIVVQQSTGSIIPCSPSASRVGCEDDQRMPDRRARRAPAVAPARHPATGRLTTDLQRWDPARRLAAGSTASAPLWMHGKRPVRGAEAAVDSARPG